jgi:photosystem II stability/assembly factor-like uncharacterized protein
LIVAVLTSAVFVSFRAAPVEAPVWRVDGPNGGQVASIAFAPSDSQRVYAADYQGGLYRSDDAGLRFDHQRFFPFTLLSLAVDPVDRDRLLAVACNPFCDRLIRSLDGGETWSAILRHRGVYGLWFGSGAAFASTPGALLRSEDGGAAWSPTSLAVPLVHQLAFDPRHPNSILAAAGGTLERLWRSDDRGQTWVLLRTPRNWSELQDVSFDPIRPGYLYGVVGYLPVRSTDGGATWSRMLPALEARHLEVLGDGTVLLSPLGPEEGKIYGIVKSDDGGATWSPDEDPGDSRTARPGDFISDAIVASPEPHRALAGGLLGVWRTDDSGRSWHPSSQGIATHQAFTVRSSTGVEPRVYAATPSGFFVREGSGPWRKAYAGPRVPGAELNFYGLFVDFQVDPADSLRLVAFDQIQMLLSLNGGRSWLSLRPLDIAANDLIATDGIAVDWASGAIYAAAYENVLGPQGPVQRARLGVTRDRGATWESLRPFFPDGQALGRVSFTVDPHDPAVLWGKTLEAGLFRSPDRGHSWQRIGRSLPEIPRSWSGFPLGFAFDPLDPRRLLVSVPGRGVWHSTNRGLSFRRLGQGLDTAPVTDLASAPDPTTGATRWFAGVASEGIYRLDGDRWTRLGDFEQPRLFSGSFAFDPENPAACYAGTLGRSVLRLDLGCQM